MKTAKTINVSVVNIHVFHCDLNSFSERERDASAWERNLLYPLCLLMFLTLTVSIQVFKQIANCAY